jgi:predicted amidophosphoribosyltransferase
MQLDRARPAPEVRLPTHLQSKLSHVGLELARRELSAGHWRAAYEFAEAAADADREGARALMAEASSREAKRAALRGDLASAELHSKRALELRPAWPAYQERRRLVGEAKAAVLRGIREPLFPDTFGPSSGRWWEYDLLGTVRGWDGARETVPPPVLLADVRRQALEDVYAVGIYQPWHVGGPVPLFTQYIRALKPAGKTIKLAAVLMRQALTEETDWVEEVDVLVPMATSLRSYQTRGFELTEELAWELGRLLCLPVVDALGRSEAAEQTRAAGGYRERAEMLDETLVVKKTHAALLEQATAVLVVDDVVTYGSTFEACAKKLRSAYPHLRVYGAALAYTETPERRARALREREALSS